MPKSGKKGIKKNAYLSLACADVKLSDFADGHVSAIRRKPIVNALAREVALCNLERSWYDEEAAESCDGEESDGGKIEHRGRKKRNKAHRKPVDPNPSGKSYPLDLWFILSEYIKPEDIKTFAILCKSSYLVCQTYTFWINLYKRYYKTEQQLPRRLQPRCIERPYCLKACVVRSLYHFYPDFSKKVSSPSAGDIYNLLKFVCVSMWRLQKNGKWLFCFKFQSQYVTSTTLNDKEKSGDNRSWTLWDACDYSGPQVLLRDVNANPEEGCKILQVTCPNFIAAPVVMGGYLADVKVTCARDMRKQKLQLTFSFSNYKQGRKNMPSLGSRDCGGVGEVLEFEPVENMVIMDWWHPQYPSFPN